MNKIYYYYYYYYKYQWNDKIKIVNEKIRSPPYSNRIEMGYSLEYIKLLEKLWEKLWEKLVKL